MLKMLKSHRGPILQHNPSSTWPIMATIKTLEQIQVSHYDLSLWYAKESHSLVSLRSMWPPVLSFSRFGIQAAIKASDGDIIQLASVLGVFPAEIRNLAKSLTITPMFRTIPSLTFNSTFPTFIIEDIPAGYTISIFNLNFAQDSGVPQDYMTPLISIRNATVDISGSLMSTFDTSNPIMNIEQANVTLSNVRVTGGSFTTVGFESMGEQSNVVFTGSIFTNIGLGYVFSVREGAHVTVSECTFDTLNGFVGLLNWGTLLMTDTTVTNVAPPRNAFSATAGIFEQNGIWNIDMVTLTLQRCTFSQIAAPNTAIRLTKQCGDIIISECTFTNFDANVLSIANAPKFELTLSSFSNIGQRYSGGRGGAVAVRGSLGAILIESNSFTYCGASNVMGGALALLDPDYSGRMTPVIIRNCTFDYNSASVGGAIQLDSKMDVLIDACRFENNTADIQGGAIQLSSYPLVLPTLKLFNSRFKLNQAVSQISNSLIGGGAVAIDAPFALINISSCEFHSNSADAASIADGGAVRIHAGDAPALVVISNSSFLDNHVIGGTAAIGGAATIRGEKVSARISTSHFNLNSASQSTNDGRLSFGGALFTGGMSSSFPSSAEVSIEDCVVKGNKASQGALVIQSMKSSSLRGVSFTSNTANFASAALLFIDKELQTALDPNRARGENLSFQGNMITRRFTDGPVRNSTCEDHGIMPQAFFDFTCSNCNFQAAASVDAQTFNGNVAVIGGETFLLTSAKNERSSDSMSDCSVDCTGRLNRLIAIKEIIVTNDLMSVIVYFDRPVEMDPFVAASGTCKDILTEASRLQPGWSYDDDSCKLSDDGFSLRISASSLPWPFEIVFISASLVDSQDAAARVPDFPLYANPPVKPVDLIAELSAPDSLAPCADLSLSGERSILPGVFPKSYNWTVGPSATASAAVTAFIDANFDQPVIRVPASTWEVSAINRTLVLILTVNTPFHGDGVWVTKSLIRFAEPAPEIAFEGPLQRKHFSAIELQLNARIAVPICLTSRGLTVKRGWRQLEGPHSAALDALLPPQSIKVGAALFLPAGSLSPGNNYKLEFSAQVDQLPDLRASFVVEINTLFSPLLVYSSGDSGWISANRSLKFETTIIDPDSSSSRTLYLWEMACQLDRDLVSSDQFLSPYATPGRECYPSCISFPLSNSSSTIIPARALPARAYSVVASVGRDGRNAQVRFLTELFAESDYIPVRLIPRWRGPKPLASDRNAVIATVDGKSQLDSTTFLAVWSLFDEADVDLGLNSSMVTTSLDNASLAIAFKPNMLEAGMSYQLRLDVFFKSNSSLAGRNWIELNMNNVPSGGNITLSKTVLTQFEEITISTSGWADEDDPLRYSFSLVMNDGNMEDELVLSDMVDVAATRVQIVFAGDFILRARVIDILGSAAVVDTLIHVNPASNGAIDISSLVDLLNMGDIRRAAAVVAMLLRDASSNRAQVAQALYNFASQTGLSSSNIAFLLRSCELLTLSGGGVIEADVRSAVIGIVVDSINFVFENEGYGTSASRLFSDVTETGSKTLRSFTQSLSAVLKTIRNNATLLLDSHTAAKLVVALERVPQIMTRLSVVNEQATVASSELLNAISLVVCGSNSVNITSGSSWINFDPTESRPCLDLGVAFHIVSWSAGSFPNSMNFTTTVGNVTSTLAPSNSAVVTVGTNQNGNTSPYNVSISFTNIVAPTDSYVTGCGQYSSTTGGWSAEGCDLKPDANKPGSFVCECAPSATPFVSYTLLFAAASEESSSSPAASDQSGSGLSTVAMAAIIVTAIVVVGAVIGVAVVMHMKKTAALRESNRVKSALNNSL